MEIGQKLRAFEKHRTFNDKTFGFFSVVATNSQTKTKTKSISTNTLIYTALSYLLF